MNGIAADGTPFAHDVPFVDLQRLHGSIEDTLQAAFAGVIGRGTFTLGPDVEEFEDSFATFCGARYGAAVASGTDALHLALRAVGVRPGDEVITAVNTFAATAEAITMCGARPVFVDVEPDTLLMDATRIEAALTGRTKAVIPVHLYGQPADMDAIADVANRHGLKVIEDACQAHGATYRGRPVGGIGDAGCFSFYPSKNLGALGDGGIVTTSDEEIDRRVKLLRNHGEGIDRLHLESGYCSRLHGLQAALLKAKLPHLKEWNEWRAGAAGSYGEAFASTPVVAPVTRPGRTHVFHLYVIRVQERERVRAELAEQGVQTGIHYPVPLHLEPAFADLRYAAGDFPEAERASREILSLPMYPYIRADEIRTVIEAVKEAVHV